MSPRTRLIVGFLLANVALVSVAVFLLLNRPASAPIKREYGVWLTLPLKIVAGLKFLRGTAFDLFGYQKERRIERQLITDYESTISKLLENLNEKTIETTIKIAELPQSIRGFGEIKTQSIAQAKESERILLDSL